MGDAIEPRDCQDESSRTTRPSGTAHCNANSCLSSGFSCFLGDFLGSEIISAVRNVSVCVSVCMFVSVYVCVYVYTVIIILFLCACIIYMLD